MRKGQVGNQDTMRHLACSQTIQPGWRCLRALPLALEAGCSTSCLLQHEGNCGRVVGLLVKQLMGIFLFTTRRYVSPFPDVRGMRLDAFSKIVLTGTLLFQVPSVQRA